MQSRLARGSWRRRTSSWRGTLLHCARRVKWKRRGQEEKPRNGSTLLRIVRGLTHLPVTANSTSTYINLLALSQFSRLYPGSYTIEGVTQFHDAIHHTCYPLNANYRPTSRRSRPAAVEGPGSGQLPTASSTSSKNVVLLWTVVPPRTTRTPGELALTCATILASS